MSDRVPERAAQGDEQPVDLAMTAAASQQKPRRPRGRRVLTWLLRILVLCVALMMVAGWSLSGKPIDMPKWVISELEGRLNAQLEGRARMSLGGLQLRLAVDARPELRVTDLRVSPPGGGGSVLLPEAVARFDGGAMLRGQIQPRTVKIVGAQLRLRRLADGSFDLVYDSDTGEPARTFAEHLRLIDELFDAPFLSTLQRVDAEAMTFTLEDRHSGRIWTMGDGRTTLARRDGETVLDVSASLVGGGSTDARAQMQFRLLPDGQGVRASVKVENVAARDVAMQSPVLALLGVLDAPISGELRGLMSPQGAIKAFEGQLSIGQGALNPVAGARAIPLNRAEVAFSFDPAAGRITASHLVIEAPEARVRARAHVDLQGLAPGKIPDAFLAQLRFDDVQIDPHGVFEEPVRFSEGALDMRLRLDPFSVELGQFVLVEDGRHVMARGEAAATTAGWNLALDIELDTIAHDRLLALWPVDVVPRTRIWLVDNVQQGTLYDVKAGLRLRPEHEPRLSLGYEFENADVRFMRTLPPIQKARGYAMIEGQTYTTVVEDGRVHPPEGGEIVVTRSVFRVPDFTLRPPPAEITLNTESPIEAALSLLDQPPFGFMQKAGLKPDLAQGRAVMQTKIQLPLARQVALADVDFTVTGELTEVVSDRLAPGRSFTSDRLMLSADRAGVSIAGKGKIGAASFDARWLMEIGPGKSGSHASGTVALDEGFVSEFLRGLPANTVSGKGVARVDLALPKGGVPKLTLSSDLAGVGLRIGEIGWSKPAASKGDMRVAVSLSQPMAIEGLKLSANGLSAEGDLHLGAGGKFERLALSRFKLGEWLETSVTLEGRGEGAPMRVGLSGGVLDLRHLPASGGAGGGGRGPSLPVDVAFDRVQVTGNLALTSLRGRLQTKAGGMDGTFNALVNGAAPITAQLVAGPRGMGVRLRAEDGGAALAAAKLFQKARGGVLDVVINPSGQRGHYDGTVSLSQFNVRNLPALADLLSAASIVGLIEQLATSGVVFTEAKGNFAITPEGVEIREGHAVGASFGVSLEGVYRTKQDWLDLQGVISPFYLVNGIGQLLTRPGEGVMGFTYRIKGSAADPQVSLNPLSVLAPGFFREILRRPPARLEGRD